MLKSPRPEPPAALLERIKAEKEQLPRGDRVRKSIPLSQASDDEVPYSLPAGWQWTRAGSVTSLIEYGTSERASVVRDGVPVLRMNNVQSGAIVTDDLKYVSANIRDLPRLLLEAGDILFNRTNSFELVGKTGIFCGNTEPFTFASYLIRLRACPGVVPEYINLVFNSPFFRETQIEPEITQQNGQANFNGTKVRHTLVPLPPSDEQIRIVSTVTELMTLCDRLEARLRHARETSARLAEALVQYVA